MERKFSIDSSGRLLINGEVLDKKAVPYTRDRETWKGKRHRSDIVSMPERRIHRQRWRGDSTLKGVEWRHSHQIAGDKFDKANRIA